MIESPKIKSDYQKDKEYILFIMIDKENILNLVEDNYNVMIMKEKLIDKLKLTIEK
jgi:hypothetical protein